MIAIGTDRLRATFDPARGGAVVSFDTRSRNDASWVPLFTAPDPSDRSALGQAMFAMVPFANRARDNRIGSDGEIQLSPNSDDPLAIHGAGWNRAWQVLDRGVSRLRLSVECRAPYPLPFRCTLDVVLDGARATFLLEVVNTGDHSMPMGLGLHPYFPHYADTELRFSAERFWLEGPEHLPTDPVTIPPELDFSDFRAVPQTWRNNCYSDWTGHAEISQLTLGYRLSMTADRKLRHLMLYTPQSGVFALEPQSHVSGEMGVAPHGLTRVAPCCALACRVVFQVDHSPANYHA